MNFGEIEKHRNFIFFMELLAFLHDIGKYYEEVKAINKKGHQYKTYSPNYHIPIGAFILNLKKLRNKQLIQKDRLLNAKGKYVVLIDTLKSFQIFSDVFNKKFLSLLSIPFIWQSLLDISIGEFAMYHHENKKIYKFLVAENNIEKLLSKADYLDSAEDREGSQKVTRYRAKLHTPFGLLENTQYELKEQQNILNKIAQCIQNKNFEKCFYLARKLKGIWSNAPADTRPPFNDTTLWNHAYMVSSIFKATVAYTLLKNKLIKPEEIADNLAILSVQSPNRDFLTAVNRLPDYNGRWEVFKEIRNEIRKLIEFNIPLGNLVYEDINGQYFLIPSLSDEEIEKLLNKITEIYQEKTKGLLLPRIKIEKCKIKGKILQIGKTIIELKKEYESNIEGMISCYHFDEGFIKPNWIEEWKEEKEICQVCFKMPAEKEHVIYHDKICKWCQERRKSKAKEDEVKFIDEVMDENQCFALLVGQVGLLDQWLNGDYIYTTFVNKETNLKKPASPSRMMRIYEEIDNFDKKIIKELKKEKEFKIKRLIFCVKYSGISKTKEDLKYKIYRHRFNKNFLENCIKEYFIKEKGKFSNLNKKTQKIINIITYQGRHPYLDLFIKDDTAETVAAYPDITIEIIKSYLEKYHDHIEFECKTDGESLKIKITSLNNFNFKEVSKIKSIYSFSGEFMYLVPGNRVLKVANKLRKEFNERYYKVQGRLCLNLGIVYADHKYPLYMVLDAGKRMLKEFQVANNLITEKEFTITNDIKAYGIRALCKKENNTIALSFKEDVFEKENQIISIDSRLRKLKVRKDKEIDDKFYPYFLRKVNGQIKPIHIDELPLCCEIIFAPGIFDFEYLNSSKIRINLTLKKKNNKWQKRGSLFPLIYTRPYRIQKIEELISAAKSFKKEKPTITALENFREILASEIYRLFKDKKDFPTNEDKELIEKLAHTLVKNMEGLKKENTLDTLLCFSKNLEIFDLLELELFLDAFNFLEEEKDDFN
ncbi:MAG: hypothetical protein LWW95_07805 [Candidatus Desulfofervidus auxilii]|nr:hypothetical protein [Candidatus Desulfofervidus auxilii]